MKTLLHQFPLYNHQRAEQWREKCRGREERESREPGEEGEEREGGQREEVGGERGKYYITKNMHVLQQLKNFEKTQGSSNSQEKFSKIRKTHVLNEITEVLWISRYDDERRERSS